MHIGMVAYLNALPLHLGMPQHDITFTFDVPAQLNAQLRAGALDGALTSSVAHLDGGYPPSDFCIAAHEEIISVNLYHKGALDRIALTAESATSVALLKVLCNHFWDVQPTFVTPEEPHDAYLLIGDAALRAQSVPGYEYVDLAAGWWRETGLPFVFALYSSHNTATPPFEEALAWSEQNREAVIAHAHAKSGLPEELLARYYALCHYRMGDAERAGLQHFEQLRHDVPKNCT